MASKIRFHVGGPRFHPTADQTREISRWLGSGYECQIADGAAAFDTLEQADLLVIMGLHWTGMTPDGDGCLKYDPLSDAQKDNLRNFVSSGRPVLSVHGGVASYDDWPEFSRLLGVAWNWNVTSHLDVAKYTVKPEPTGHPIIAGVPEFELIDEVYVNLQFAWDLDLQVHARVPYGGGYFPAVVTGAGGRIPGSGRMAYLANGHDLRAFEAPEMKVIWKNAVRWLLEKPAA